MHIIADYITHKITEKTFKAKVPGGAERKANELQATFLDAGSKTAFTLTAILEQNAPAVSSDLTPMTPVEIHLRVKRGDYGDELGLLSFKALNGKHSK